MSTLAKALYDNTAECADELAFRKGDIVIVVDQHVAGTSGWWMCSLYGRHGLAPANRLQLLPQTGATAGFLHQVMEKPKLTDAKTDDSMQNIYQIPSVPRPSSNPAYECMDKMYKVPSTTSKNLSALKHSPEGPEGDKLTFCNLASSPKGEVYDVPVQARRVSLFTAPSTTSRHMSRKHSLIQISELEKRFEGVRCSSPGDSYVYAVPPPLPQDPNYDIPVPSATETQQNMIGVYSTLPNPRKPEWIYDVPVGPEKLSPPQGSYDTMPHKAVCRQLYDTLPAHAWPTQRCSPTPSVYDIPKPSSLDISSPPKVFPIYDKPPTQMTTEESVYAVPPQEEPFTRVLSDPPSDHIPLECRGDSGNVHELNRVCLQKMRNFLACTSFHDLPGSGESLVQEDSERGRILRLSAADSQRISTASSSSTSSCDSLALSSSSPEPLREVTLSQDEACRRLLELQESICRAVPRLMDFVSSHWRSKEHLQKHLQEIKEAAEAIACSLTCFLNFALDVKGNARRLTDANLQTRLYKQLSIIEDSGVILQQTVGALNMAGWPLNTLCQDPGQVQTPDQLERFVMVARTIPEDVKRLVSIIIANGKLLFRASQKDPQPLNITAPPETKKGPSGGEQEGDLVEDDNDYVELQTKNDFEKQQKKLQREPKENVTPVSNKAQADNKRHSSESSSGTEEQRSPSMSEHCRLYFGALQKAIRGFVGSLQDGQPPEKFISQSKLVIMVGQRLVDTLCREAQRGGSGQSLLCKSNHLCALLKQLAVATKKAALHFPDKQALHEAQEFAKELAQRAQHFRISLDL
ncbi:cas scaffolding protein family member 4 [Seriola lalandi dorsalis]|uniref:Cas scaffold protein family member 4 n=1 Tax=Seriola lalandi dorsalis TaxID=1841481 RepID=A0A3B4XT33_SERLL|nr:cas scaffolding protein family member 4 [Seriola lalandi dorsalis]XP_056258451.1 cas scaffolding protein family member 4 [Seriola aureovittata]